jgi:hypothetical protein
MMRWIYVAACGALGLLGAVHVAATPQFFPALTPSALWFAAGGLWMILVAALNFLNRSYGKAAPGLRTVCVISNAVLTGFAIIQGLVGHAGIGQWSVVLSILIPMLLLSASRRVQAR